MTDVEKQAQQWLDESPHLNQRDLGKRVGMTSHEVGRALTDLGLRSGKHPTPDAYKKKMVIVEQSGDWPQYRWNERRVIPLFRAISTDAHTQVHEQN